MARNNNHRLLECGFTEYCFGVYTYKRPQYIIHVYIRENGWGAGIERGDNKKWGEKEHETAELAALAVIDFVLDTDYVPYCKGEFSSIRALVEEKSKEPPTDAELSPFEKHQKAVDKVLDGWKNPNVSGPQGNIRKG